MKERHTTFYVNDISPVNFCGQTVAWQMGLNGAYEKPFEVTDTKGEHDYKTCEGCRSVYKELVKRLTEKFQGNGEKKGFPLCCPHHAKLNDIKEFDRASFISVPEMVATKIIYTNNHILNNQDLDDYYKEITDYIDYVVESFGQMPSGCGEPLYLSDYFYYVKDLLGNNNKQIKQERKKNIIAFLDSYTTTTKDGSTDLNILVSTYQKWFKIFPFDISFFSELKSYYEKHLPILNGKPESNKYSGAVKLKFHSKNSLIEVLLNLTNHLLTTINSNFLYEKGLLSEPQKTKLELIINERRLKLKQGYINKSRSEENRYRKILKEWFADEKKFIEEIIPFVQNIPSQHGTSGKKFNVDDFKFSPDVILKSKEEFKDLLFERYGSDYHANELDMIVDKFYGKDSQSLKQEAKKKFDARNYMKSLHNIDVFEKCMKDKKSNIHYKKLLIEWEKIEQKKIITDNLQEISKGTLGLFVTYLERIFEIYTHAFNYHDNNSEKDLQLIQLKRSKFDMLMTEQTDFFIEHLIQNKVAGNYKIILNRKDYVLGLFKSIKRFLVNASINFSKSPFIDIFQLSEGKIKSCISFEEIKFLSQTETKVVNEADSGFINWIDIYKQLDLEKKVERQVYKTTDYEGKKNYFSKASFNLTIQYLHYLKKETDFFTDQRKFDYIKALDIKPPKPSGTENPTFNQTVFEAQQNYYEFLQAYSKVLSENTVYKEDEEKPQLSIRQVALKHCYEGIQITRANGDEIAKQYGHTSGEALFQKYTFYSSPTNRKSRPNPCTPRKLRNKINLLESIIPFLPIDRQARVEDEIKILHEIFKNEY